MTQSKQSQRVQRETRNHLVCQSECHRANTLNNIIISSSLNTKGIVKIHHPSFAILEGTNDRHHYILTEYRGKVKIHHPSLASLEGTNDVHIVTSSLNTEGKRRSIAHPQPAWRAPTMAHEATTSTMQRDLQGVKGFNILYGT